MEEKDTKKTKTEEVKPRPTKLEEIDTWKMRALVEKAGRISSTMNSLELQFNAMKKEQDEAKLELVQWQEEMKNKYGSDAVASLDGTLQYSKEVGQSK